MSSSFDLYMPSAFDINQSGSNVFSKILQPLRWDGLNFSYEERHLDENSPDLFSFSGSISRDGRLLSLVYTIADTSHSFNPHEYYEHLRITNLPFDPTTSSIFTVGGPEIQNYVSEAVWSTRRWDDSGVLEYESVFREFWWDIPGYKALTCSFGGAQGRR